MRSYAYSIAYLVPILYAAAAGFSALVCFFHPLLFCLYAFGFFCGDAFFFWGEGFTQECVESVQAVSFVLELGALTRAHKF